MVIIGNGANSGTVAGRYGVEVLIQEATVVGQSGTFTTTTWSAGLYKKLRLEIQQTATSSGAGIDTITLASITGTWTCRQFLVNTVLAENSFGRTSIKVGWNGSMPASGTWNFYTSAAPKLKFFDGVSFLTAPTPQSQYQSGSNDDTTNDVTGLTFTLAGAGTLDFNFRLWGVPA